MQYLIGRTNTLLLVLIAVMCAGVLGLMATRASGGPLDPSGPPAPTMKTLDQIEPRTPITSIPFVITQPGSYYLTGNMTATSAYIAINISASNVTVDLSGFTLDGNNVGQFGVIITGAGKGVVVKNGTATRWTQRGFDFYGALGGVFDGLRATDNQDGIWVARSTVTNCVVTGNVAAGLQAQSDTVSGCSAFQNGEGYILLGSTLMNSVSLQNTGAGIDAAGGVVENCVSQLDFYGILVHGGTNVRQNTVIQSGSDGIRVTGGGTASTVEQNMIEGAGATQSASGIWVETTYNHVEDNNVSKSNGNGIGVASNFNFIGGNSTYNNSIVGITVTGSKNTVVRNVSQDNHPALPITNYTIGAGNNDAPVVAAAAATNPLSNTQ